MAHTELDLRERRAIEIWRHAKMPFIETICALKRHNAMIFREIKCAFRADEALPKTQAGDFGQPDWRETAGDVAIKKGFSYPGLP
jgi:IS30 family transposase